MGKSPKRNLCPLCHYIIKVHQGWWITNKHLDILRAKATLLWLGKWTILLAPIVSSPTTKGIEKAKYIGRGKRTRVWNIFNGICNSYQVAINHSFIWMCSTIATQRVKENSIWGNATSNCLGWSPTTHLNIFTSVWLITSVWLYFWG